MNANTSLKQAIRQIYIAGIFSWKIEPVPGYGPVIRSSWSGGCFRVQRVPQDHRPEIIVRQEFHLASGRHFNRGQPFRKGKRLEREAEFACRENIHEEIRYTIQKGEKIIDFLLHFTEFPFFPPFELRWILCFPFGYLMYSWSSDPLVYGIYIFRNYSLRELLVNSLF